MPKASELKKGQVVEFKNQLCIVRQIDVQNPSSRGAATLYRVRFSTIGSKQKLEERFKGDDQLTAVDLLRRKVSFSYMDGDNYIFMDDEDFAQYPLGKDDLDTDALYITDGMTGAMALIVDGNAIALELPATVEMEILETAPALKGASASARTKPATFVTGLTVQVPEYLATGERIKINTEDGSFSSRA